MTIPQDNLPTFKIVFVGEANTGKTAFLFRHLSGQFRPQYTPTLGVEVYPLRFQTNLGPICFNVWDCAGDERYGGLRDGYFLMANGCLLFGGPNVGDLEKWNNDVVRVTGPVPTIVVSSKNDLVETKTRPVSNFAIRKGLPFVSVSSRCNDNCERPFLLLAKRLLGEGVTTMTIEQGHFSGHFEHMNI